PRRRPPRGPRVGTAPGISAPGHRAAVLVHVAGVLGRASPRAAERGPGVMGRGRLPPAAALIASLRGTAPLRPGPLLARAPALLAALGRGQPALGEHGRLRRREDKRRATVRADKVLVSMLFHGSFRGGASASRTHGAARARRAARERLAMGVTGGRPRARSDQKCCDSMRRRGGAARSRVLGERSTADAVAVSTLGGPDGPRTTFRRFKVTCRPTGSRHALWVPRAEGAGPRPHPLHLARRGWTPA